MPIHRTPYEIQSYVAGLAHFRAGEYALATERLKHLADSQESHPPSQHALPVLAMTYRALGQNAEAESVLSQAVAAFDE